MVHDDDPGSERLSFLQVVRGEQNGPAARDVPPDRPPYRATRFNVEPGRRFVQHGEFRRAGEGGRDGEPPRLATAESACAALALRSEFEHLDQFFGAERMIVVGAHEVDNLRDAEHRWEVDVLRRYAEFSPRFRRARIVSKESYATGIGRAQPREQLDCRALAGAVGPEQNENLSGTDLEIEAVERDVPSVAFDDVRQLR